MLFNFEGAAFKWGCSSAGRAPALHAGGQEFDPPHLHQRDEERENNRKKSNRERKEQSEANEDSKISGITKFDGIAKQ